MVVGMPGVRQDPYISRQRVLPHFLRGAVKSWENGKTSAFPPRAPRDVNYLSPDRLCYLMRWEGLSKLRNRGLFVIILIFSVAVVGGFLGVFHTKGTGAVVSQTFNGRLRLLPVQDWFHEADGSRSRIKPVPAHIEVEKPGEGWNRGRFSSDGIDSCDPSNAAVRLYMYDLPPEFNFAMRQKNLPLQIPATFSRIPLYPGGMYRQHSPEYWLTIDLMTSTMKERQYPCVAVRVARPEDADMIYVPFFASCAFNKYSNSKTALANVSDENTRLQLKLVEYLHNQELWNKSQGRDHILVIHHPNSMRTVREELRAAMFILADFGRYNSSVANIEKDVIAPYKHLIPSFVNDTNGYDKRPILLFFQGMIVRKEGGIIRQRLYELIKDEEGVHFVTGNTQRQGIRTATEGMRTSRFCLHLAGDTPSSNRLFDAIVSHCVPVIISDEIELPFKGFLNYTEFSLQIMSQNALKPGYLINLLRNISPKKWTRMWRKLKKVEHHFDYFFPSRPNDATQLTWREIARRVPRLKKMLKAEAIAAASAKPAADKLVDEVEPSEPPRQGASVVAVDGEDEAARTLEPRLSEVHKGAEADVEARSLQKGVALDLMIRHSRILDSNAAIVPNNISEVAATHSSMGTEAAQHGVPKKTRKSLTKFVEADGDDEQLR